MRNITGSPGYYGNSYPAGVSIYHLRPTGEAEPLSFTGKLVESFIEGRHLELETDRQGILVIIPANPQAAAELEKYLGQWVTLGGTLFHEPNIYMRSPLLRVQSVRPAKTPAAASLATPEQQAIVVEQSREVIPNVLVVTKTVSDYAHAQHLIWVEGRFKRTEGELYLTLFDRHGRQLESSGFRPADEVKQLDATWSVFSHKLVEDTRQKVDIDQGRIVFELRKPGEQVLRGELEIPMRRPPAGNGGSASLGESAARKLRLRWEKELPGVTALGFLPAGSLVVVEGLGEKGSHLTTLDPAWVER